MLITAATIDVLIFDRFHIPEPHHASSLCGSKAPEIDAVLTRVNQCAAKCVNQKAFY